LPPPKIERLVVEAFTKLTVEEATRENGPAFSERSVEVVTALCP